MAHPLWRNQEARIALKPIFKFVGCPVIKIHTSLQNIIGKCLDYRKAKINKKTVGGWGFVQDPTGRAYTAHPRTP